MYKKSKREDELHEKSKREKDRTSYADGSAFFVLAMSVCTVKTEAKDYKQGKVYKITAKSKPLKASKFTKSSLYNKKTRMYFTIRSYMEKFQKKGKGTLILKKGTYTITNTIHVPSNVTIIFEKGVKIVKGTKTNKKKMPAAITLFQLIRPSNAKRKAFTVPIMVRKTFTLSAKAVFQLT